MEHTLAHTLSFSHSGNDPVGFVLVCIGGGGGGGGGGGTENPESYDNYRCFAKTLTVGCQVSEIAKVSARKAFRAAVLVNPAERKMTSTSGRDSHHSRLNPNDYCMGTVS